MDDILAALLVVFVLCFLFDIVDVIFMVLFFAASRLAKVVDILIDKLRGTSG